MASIQKEILELLIEKSEALGLPQFIQLDYLPAKKDALSIQPDASPKVEKAYIGGTKICTFPFTVLATTSGAKSSAPNLKAIDWLNTIGDLFEGMSNFKLSETRRILSAEAMTPAMANRLENGQLVYTISINIRYEE